MKAEKKGKLKILGTLQQSNSGVGEVNKAQAQSITIIECYVCVNLLI